MNISGFDKLSLIDYPDKLACIIFTQGCNLNCSYCHNPELIPHQTGTVIEEEIFNYLNKRKNILDGVVITGGEPLLQKNIKSFIKKIKKIGFKIKLDTNGSNYKLLKELIEENLIDYVALDIKHDENNYLSIKGLEHYNFNNIKENIKILENSKINYEFRTTVIKDYHNINSLKNICSLIKKESPYYLQKFENSEQVRNKELQTFSKEELINIINELKKIHPNIKLRGL